MSRRSVLSGLSLILCGLLSAITVSAAIDLNFNALLGRTTQTTFQQTAVQPDGKIIITGNFGSVNGIARLSIVRLNADGTLDASFKPPAFALNTETNNQIPVKSIAVQPNGKILVGGSFIFNGRKRGLVRLNSDGSPDTAFNDIPNLSTFVGTYDIEVAADGKIIYSGFTKVVEPSTSYPAFVQRLSAEGVLEASVSSYADNLFIQPDGKIIFTQGTILYRFNQNLSLDNTFPNYNGGYNDVAIQSDGRLIVGGRFTGINGYNLVRAARINTDGTIDTTFNVTNRFDPNNDVTRVIILPNGKILIGGLFTALNGTPANRLALINADGTPDASFNASSLLPDAALSNLIDLDVQPDGKILVTFNNGIYRLNANGTSDNSFALPVFGRPAPAYDILVQPDDKILVAGDFSLANEKNISNLARFNADGTVDNNFNQNAVVNQSRAIALQPDGKILSGGGASNNVVRLNPNGSTDVVLPASAGAEAIAVGSDGKILVGGAGYISRYNADGSRDNSFSFSMSLTVYDLAIQNDGKILVGANSTDSLRRAFRLNTDGSFDTAFIMSGGVNGNVFSLALQADGKILIGGIFTGVNFDSAKKYLARLNADGSLDTTFAPVVDMIVRDIKIQPNGKILIGGDSTDRTTTPINGKIARFNQNGSVDQTFDNSAFIDAIVSAVDSQSDNKAILGGSFTAVNGTAEIGIARLTNNAGSAKFDFDGDGKADVSVFRPENGTWYIQRSSTGFTGLAFGQTGDKLVPADYDGDGKTDIAVVRNGIWYIQRSQSGFTGIQFGDSADVPVPADYDGDGKADIAVFRPSNGYWYLLRSTLGFTGIAFGQNGDKPVAADYDGDGKADIAVNRAGNWYLNRSQLGFIGIQFGDGNDKSVPADYDGDGKADIAVFRPSNGTWYLLQSTAGFAGLTFGFGTDAPAAADYDGDGKADIAVFRSGTWYLQRSSQGFTGIAFGNASDKPIPNTFVN